MSEYKYESPLENGYKQFYLSKKQHNSLFEYRQIKWRDKYEYYYNENQILLHRFYNLRLIVASIVLLPVTILINGLGNIGEIISDLKRLFNQKENGSFSGDTIWRSSKMYGEIIGIINKNNKVGEI